MVHSLEVVVSGHAVFVQGFIIFVRLINELVWMLHALVRKWHVLGFFFFVGLFATSIFSIGTLPVLASSLSCVPIC